MKKQNKFLLFAGITAMICLCLFVKCTDEEDFNTNTSAPVKTLKDDKLVLNGTDTLQVTVKTDDRIEQNHGNIPDDPSYPSLITGTNHDKPMQDIIPEGKVTYYDGCKSKTKFDYPDLNDDPNFQLNYYKHGDTLFLEKGPWYYSCGIYDPEISEVRVSNDTIYVSELWDGASANCVCHQTVHYYITGITGKNYKYSYEVWIKTDGEPKKEIPFALYFDINL
ncbi:MAG: hypothetical protein J6P44_03900 [Bacteroidales bacterium]|nr:hypothetical protein [Bacteroidales bacterium]